MRLKCCTFVLALLLILPFLLSCASLTPIATAETPPDLYFGVDVAYGNLTLTEHLVDEISSYTNLFIIGCTNSYNQTQLTVLSQYLYDRDMYFIVYTDFHRYPSQQWLQTAQSEWGSRFLGIYYYDEPGGKQLDQTFPTVTYATNYTDAANQYVRLENNSLRGPRSIVNSFAYPSEYPLFTSDYGLYWYDYESGYNAVFAEFGSNYSRQLNVDLCRGAAIVQNKSWGVMIDWTYRQPPYIENGTLLYNDMLLAYNNGAKYIVIFDSNKNYTEDILQQQNQNDLPYMQEFWQYVLQHPRDDAPTSSKVACVLPEDFGYGFRGTTDTIWGLWTGKSNSEINLTINDVCWSVGLLLQKYGGNMDIVYPNESPSIVSLGYQYVIDWNDTALLTQLLGSTYQNGIPTMAQKAASPGTQIGAILLPASVAGACIIAVAATAFVKLKKKSHGSIP